MGHTVRLKLKAQMGLGIPCRTIAPPLFVPDPRERIKDFKIQTIQEAQ